MVAVAAGDELTVDAVLGAVLAVGDVGGVCLHVMRHDVGCLVDDDAVHGVAGVIEVLGDFRLAVYHDTVAAGQPGQVDAVAGAGESDVEPS